jgi:hypothetical protein
MLSPRMFGRGGLPPLKVSYHQIHPARRTKHRLYPIYTIVLLLDFREQKTPLFERGPLFMGRLDPPNLAERPMTDFFLQGYKDLSSDKLVHVPLFDEQRKMLGEQEYSLYKKGDTRLISGS